MMRTHWRDIILAASSEALVGAAPKSVLRAAVTGRRGGEGVVKESGVQSW